MKGRCGGPRSKPYHSSLHSYLGKEGFALPGRDGEMEGGGGGETRRTGGPLSEREGGYGGRMGDKGKTDQEGKRGRFIIKILLWNTSPPSSPSDRCSGDGFTAKPSIVGSSLA